MTYKAWVNTIPINVNDYHYLVCVIMNILKIILVFLFSISVHAFPLTEEQRAKLHHEIRISPIKIAIDPLRCGRVVKPYFILKAGSKRCKIFNKPQNDHVQPEVYTLVNMTSETIKFASIAGAAYLEPNDMTISYGRFILDSERDHAVYNIFPKLKEKLFLIGDVSFKDGDRVTYEDNKNLTLSYFHDAVRRNELMYIEPSGMHPSGYSNLYGPAIRGAGMVVVAAAQGASLATFGAIAESYAFGDDLDMYKLSVLATGGAAAGVVEKFTNNSKLAAAIGASVVGGCASCHMKSNKWPN
ncbi:hypothetical protein [Aeromonas salmonicida]|uniref:hypothetical protein n=1 Tax=Aeromonas salmonicida TaxID=645 RepID=UPI0030DD3EFB